MVKGMKWFGISLLLVLLTYLVFDQVVKDRIFPKRFAEVESGLYRSGQIHANLIEGTLRDHEISKVIDLRHWEEKPNMIAERDAIAKLGIDSERFPLNGNGTGILVNAHTQGPEQCNLQAETQCDQNELVPHGSSSTTVTI